MCRKGIPIRTALGRCAVPRGTGGLGRRRSRVGGVGDGEHDAPLAGDLLRKPDVAGDQRALVGIARRGHPHGDRDRGHPAADVTVRRPEVPRARRGERRRRLCRLASLSHGLGRSLVWPSQPSVRFATRCAHLPSCFPREFLLRPRLRACPRSSLFPTSSSPLASARIAKGNLIS
jgi:hypothetical protein